MEKLKDQINILSKDEKHYFIFFKIKLNKTKGIKLKNEKKTNGCFLKKYFVFFSYKI